MLYTCHWTSSKKLLQFPPKIPLGTWKLGSKFFFLLLYTHPLILRGVLTSAFYGRWCFCTTNDWYSTLNVLRAKGQGTSTVTCNVHPHAAYPLMHFWRRISVKTKKPQGTYSSDTSWMYQGTGTVYSMRCFDKWQTGTRWLLVVARKL